VTGPEESGFLGEADLDHLIDNAPKCEPGCSVLHGYGLFAKEYIVAGEVVVDFSDPELYREVPVEVLPEWRLKGGKFTALSLTTCLISDRFTKYSLVNHSREPSAGLDLERRVMVALRDITPGEEITADYRSEPRASRVAPYLMGWL
jgi:SET domain-containing protein